MPLDFPSSPALNDTYTFSGKTWKWNGEGWALVTNPDGSILTAMLADSAVTSAKIADGTIVNADVNASAAIAFSKLATLTSGNILVGNASNVAASVAVTGDVTITNAGVTSIAAKAVTAGDIADAGLFTITTTATSKTLANRERCTVTAAGQTITLPASPAAGWEVAITIAGTFTDTIVARNSTNIMSLAENLTIDSADVTVTLYYVDATRGWRII